MITKSLLAPSEEQMKPAFSKNSLASHYHTPQPKLSPIAQNLMVFV